MGFVVSNSNYLGRSHQEEEYVSSVQFFADLGDYFWFLKLSKFIWQTLKNIYKHHRFNGIDRMIKPKGNYSWPHLLPIKKSVKTGEMINRYDPVNSIFSCL